MNDRVIALAALAQSLRLVHQLATLGQTEQRPESVLFDSLFRFDAEDAEAVYGGVGGLDQGLRELLGLLGHGRRDPAVGRMGVTVLALERRLVGHPTAGARVQEVLRDIDRQRQHLGAMHPTVINRLGELYAEQVSPLGTKVLVQGTPVYLAQAPVVAEVRALLLCAVRAAVLWRQSGGSRLDFVFRRGSLVHAAQTLLSPRS